MYTFTIKKPLLKNKNNNQITLALITKTSIMLHKIAILLVLTFLIGCSDSEATRELTLRSNENGSAETNLYIDYVDESPVWDLSSHTMTLNFAFSGDPAPAPGTSAIATVELEFFSRKRNGTLIPLGSEEITFNTYYDFGATHPIDWHIISSSTNTFFRQSFDPCLLDQSENRNGVSSIYTKISTCAETNGPLLDVDHSGNRIGGDGNTYSCTIQSFLGPEVCEDCEELMFLGTVYSNIDCK